MRRMKITAMILAFALAVMAPMQAMGTANVKAAESKKYVSEVFTAYGEDEAAAKSALESKGYTPVKGNLNDGAGTYVMMGYKTTDDADKAITDLALMNSAGGYSVGDYENLLKKKREDITAFLTEFMQVIKEYRANYKNNDPKAIIAHDLLNNYIEDDSGKKMGDLLLGDTRQDKEGIEESVTSEDSGKTPDLTEIVLQGNTVAIRTIYSVLAMSTDSQETNLIDRFANNSYEKMLKQAEEKRPDDSQAKLARYLDGQYSNTARMLVEMSTEMRDELKEYEKGDLKVDKATPEDVEKEYGETDKVDDFKESEKVFNKTNWMATAVLYEGLKNYEGGQFKKGELLKFFMEEPKDEDEAVKKMYPLAAVMTKGQIAALSMTSLTPLLRYSFLDDKGWNAEVKNTKENNKNIENVSVYEGVDRDVFKTDGSVAMTDEAKRARAAAMEVDYTEPSFWDIFSTSVLVSYGVTAASLAGAVAMGKHFANLQPQYQTMFEQFAESVAKDPWLKLSEYEISAGFQGMVEARGSAEKAYDWLTKTAMGHEHPERDTYMSLAKAYDLKKSLLTGLKYLTIALALFSAGITIYSAFSTDDVELPPVPKYIVDSQEGKDGKAKTIYYTAASGNGEDFIKKGNKGAYADSKAYQGQQWLVIYASKDKQAGKPLSTDFVVQTDKEIPQDYNGVMHKIGEKGAVNLVSVKYMNYSKAKALKNKNKSVYMFYKHNTDSGTASAFSGGTIALIAFAGIAIGALLAVLVMRTRRKGGAAA